LKYCFVCLQIEKINHHLPCLSSIHNIYSSTGSRSPHLKRSTAEIDGIDVQAWMGYDTVEGGSNFGTQYLIMFMPHAVRKGPVHSTQKPCDLVRRPHF